MGSFAAGDVILAPLRFGGAGGEKTRPAVVITAVERNALIVCPVSSTPPTDAACIPLSLDGFARGGLDLFDESYILTAHTVTIRTASVVGKKGRLTGEMVAALTAAVQADGRP
ncbi:type II toxin-antitoxin system PemK/MazF family toxin [Methanoculleus frigidifontis]|nr:type II toxin-antitoxin system PemK/MazF family toxin [Methanoculleus sp. FWC-SCC1]